MTKATRRPRIFTLGHSDCSLDEFMLILERSSIRLGAENTFKSKR